jgi:hypothetical protein
MYDPLLGRFLQTDPTGFGAGDMNLFRYCGDDPVDRSDPMGLEADIEMYRAGDPLKTYAGNMNKLPDWPSTFIYAGHGSQQPEELGQVKDPRYNVNVMGRSPTLPAGRVIDSITRDSRFASRAQIFLAVCSAGARGSTLASHVAAATGKPVVAPDKMLWITQSGHYFAADPVPGSNGRKADAGRMGNLVKFTPDGKSVVIHRYYSDATRGSGGGLPTGASDSSRSTSTSNGSSLSAAQIDAANQALGIPSLAAEATNFAPGRP